MNPLQEAAFRLNGGWYGVAAEILIGAAKWVGIGLCFHLGWKLVA
jgi:hypothetical protein